MSQAILVLDGEQRAALAAVRSLGRQGWRVQVGSSAPRSMAGGSRFAAGEALLPDPLGDSAAYCQAVMSLAARHQARTVLPVAEASSLALLEHAQELSGILIPTSNLERFRRACDKEAVLATAATIGIAVPSQWTVSGPGDPLPAIPSTSFPLVIKPSRSVAGRDGERRKVGVQYAHDLADLVRLLQESGPDAGPYLLQERIEGPGLGVFLLRWNGKILASFAHRRIREKPPSGGVSVCCESVALPPALLAQSIALLEAIDWNGVAMVEYKADQRTGRNYLMEINPRFWGSLQLAIDAGVDFPALLVAASQGEARSPVMEWKVGRRSRWWWGDIDHLIARLRHSRAALDLPPDAPGLLATSFNVLLPWRPRQQNDVFRLSDPIPGIRESLAWFQAL